MIAIDTNVLVRFLVQDDRKQCRIVYDRFKQAEVNHERLFIPLIVVLETIWVLKSAYEMPRDKILYSIENLMQMPILDFESDRVLTGLLVSGRKCKTDLSDLLIAHAAEAAGCTEIITFDKKASRFPSFKLLK